jgi:hypothetical protein
VGIGTQTDSVEFVGVVVVVVAEDADVSTEDSVKVGDADVSTEVTVEDAEISTEDEAVAEEVAESTELLDSTNVLDSTDETDDVSTDTVEVPANVVLAANNDIRVLVFTTYTLSKVLTYPARTSNRRIHGQ